MKPLRSTAWHDPDMCWALLVLRYVRALVWPALVVGMVLLFREQLRSLIGRISEVSGGGVSVKVREDAKTAEALADALPDAVDTPSGDVTIQDVAAEGVRAGNTAPPRVQESDPATEPKAFDAMKTEAYFDLQREGGSVLPPSATGVLTVWRNVERAAAELGRRLGLTPRESRNVTRVVGAAYGRGLVSQVAVQLAEQMQKIRNEIVHEDSNLDVGTADSIMRSMSLLYATLATVAQQSYLDAHLHPGGTPAE